MVSDLTGEPAEPGRCSPIADYWVRHARGTTRFQDGVRSLVDLGCTRFLEVGPGGDLAALATRCLVDVPSVSAPVPSLRRNRPETETLLTAVATLHVGGRPVDWAAVFAGRGARRVPLPTYAFQRERYWLAAAVPTGHGAADIGAAGLTSAGHPLLGALVELPESDGLVLSGRLSLADHPWLADHQVAGTVLVPGTALLSMADWAARKAGCDTVEELVLEAPLVVPDDAEVQLRVFVTAPDPSGARTVTVHARRADGEAPGEWTRHAQGTLTNEPAEPPAELRTWPPVDAEPVAVASDQLYADLAVSGLEYGPAFRGVRAMWRRGRRSSLTWRCPTADCRPTTSCIQPCWTPPCTRSRWAAWRTCPAGPARCRPTPGPGRAPWPPQAPSCAFGSRLPVPARSRSTWPTPRETRSPRSVLSGCG